MSNTRFFQKIEKVLDSYFLVEFQRIIKENKIRKFNNMLSDENFSTPENLLRMAVLKLEKTTNRPDTELAILFLIISSITCLNHSSKNLATEAMVWSENDSDFPGIMKKEEIIKGYKSMSSTS